MRSVGIKDVTGEKARRVRRFLEDAGVLARTGPNLYRLGPLGHCKDDGNALLLAPGDETEATPRPEENFVARG